MAGGKDLLPGNLRSTKGPLPFSTEGTILVLKGGLNPEQKVIFPSVCVCVCVCVILSER
jgi:hypothetical protein